MNKEIESYHTDSDRVAAFISEELTEDLSQSVTIIELYPEYEKWCTRNNYQALGKTKFTDYFRRMGRLRNQLKINGKNYKNVIKGYYINPFKK